MRSGQFFSTDCSPHVSWDEMHRFIFEDTMEPIRQAVERAKATGVAPPEPQGRPISARQVHNTRPDHSLHIKEVQLDRQHLESCRLIAHNAADPRASSFDMLRTQVLQSMDQRNWQFLAVTSPTAGCGKTVTSINLALSIARQH